MANITKTIKRVAPFAYFFLLIFACLVLTFYFAGYSFYPVTIWGLLMIVLFIIWLFISNKNWEIISNYKILFISSFAFVVLLFISYIVPPYSNFGYTTFILFFCMYLIFIMTATVKWEKIHIRWILHILCFIALGLSIYGIYRFIVFPYERLTGPFFIGTDSFKFFQNAFGFLLVLIIPIQTLYFLNQATKDTWTLRKIYFYISSIFIFSAFFLVYSRAALIALFVLSLLFIIIQLSRAAEKKEFFSGKAMQAMLLVLVASFVVISMINWARSFTYEISSADVYLNLNATEHTSSFLDRFDYMKGALYLGKDYPLFGIGVNNFSFYYPQYQQNALSSDHPYNFALKAFSEVGVMAALTLMIFIVAAFVYYIRNYKNVEQKYYTGALAFALFGAGIQSSIDYNINFIIITAILSLFLGLFISRFKLKKIKNERILKIMTISISSLFVLFITVVSLHELNGRNFLIEANSLYAKGEYKSAANLYEKAADKSWFKEDYQIRSAKMYEKLYSKGEISNKEMELWLEAAHKATLIDPVNPESYNAYAQALCAKNMLDEALLAYQKDINMDPYNLEYYYNLLKCKGTKGTLSFEDISYFYKKVLRDYNNVLKENPFVLFVTDDYVYADKMYRFLKANTARWDDEYHTLHQELIQTLEKYNIRVLNGGQERT